MASKIKPIKALKNAHTSNAKVGMGDFKGTGIKQKVGTSRVDMVSMNKVGSKKMGKPPKALA